MGGMYGADVAQLRQLAHQFDHAAGQLDAHRTTVGNAIRISAWVGPVAVRFRAQWDSDYSRRVHSAAERLRAAAGSLRANADDQDRTSAADTASAPKNWNGHGSAAGDKAPTSAQGLVDGLSSMNDKEDSFRIMTILGDDGKKRYIVYLGGSDSSSHMPLLQSIESSLNQLDGATQYYIDKIKAATTADPGAEVMIVGFSQGGMIAQNIADHSSINVKTVVTFASPALQDSNGYGGADVIRISDPLDPVPHLIDAGRVALGPLAAAQGFADAINVKARATTSAFTPDGLDEHFQARGPELLNVHSLENYRDVASEFQQSAATEEARQSISRFSGTVLHDEL